MKNNLPKYEGPPPPDASNDLGAMSGILLASGIKFSIQNVDGNEYDKVILVPELADDGFFLGASKFYFQDGKLITHKLDRRGHCEPGW